LSSLITNYEFLFRRVLRTEIIKSQ